MRYNKENPKTGRVLLGSGPRDQQKRLNAVQPIEALSQDDRVVSLREEVVKLKETLLQVPKKTAGTFTAEDVDKAINDALPEIEQHKATAEAKQRQYDGVLVKLGERDKALAGLQMDLNHEKEKVILRDKDLVNARNETTEVNNKLVMAEAKFETLTDKIASLEEIIKTKDDAIEAIKNAPPTYVHGDGAVVVEDPDRPKMEKAYIDPLESDAGAAMEPHITVEDVKTTDKINVNDKVAKLKGLMGTLPTRK
ncbi:hypothetical protein DRQ25_01625 [Candidatus Fermentibacteria bacterium]|nr:MAG: hypothetical protein DRQ25_01625 [Candidatus Fermentibacteria bacterium]